MRTPERYCRLIGSGSPIEASGETLGPEQREWENLVLSLRTRQGVPAAAAPEELFEAGLVEWQPSGARPGVGRAVLTPRGRLLGQRGGH